MQVIINALVAFAALAAYGLARFAWDVAHAGWGGPSGFDAGLERAAKETGARFARRRPGSLSARGTIGDIVVSISTRPARRVDVPDGFTELVVTMESPRIPRGLAFAVEGHLHEDVLTGDPVFDDAVEVHGQPSIALALLTMEVRQKVAVFVRYGGSLRESRLVGRAPLMIAQSDIPACVRMTWRLAEDLSSAEGGGISARLARNAAEDPKPGVRLLNLLQLHEGFAGTAEAREASRAALADTSPWVRLAGARFIHDEVETLEALVRDREVADQTAAEAVALLGARLPPDRAGPLLVEILKSRTGEAQRRAIEELGRLRHGPAFGPLVVVMDRSDPRTATTAATALGALGDARAETSLLAVLGPDAPELRLAAARALGVLGSVRSVAPLLALLETRGLDAATLAATRGAIAAIQSRLVGAGAGQLTVADATAESGRLSLAGAEVGALSLASESEEADKDEA